MKSSIVKNDGGFTLVELLTGIIILAVIILISFSFFIYQSRMAAAAYKKSAGHESVAMALKLLQRDLAHAQNALSANPELAILVTNEADGFYHELYINYSRFLNSRYSPSVPNVFTASGYKSKAQVLGGVFTIDAPTEDERKANLANIGCALIASDPFIAGNIQAKIVKGVSGGTGTFPATFTLENTSGLPANFKLAPAIGYMLAQTPIIDPISNTPYQALLRYGSNIPGNANVGQRILGAEFQETAAGDAGFGQKPTLVINNFRVRCLFVDLDGVALVWVPSATRNFAAMPAANLRYLEVRINYSTQEPMEAFGNTVTVEAVKTMRISPRLTTLNVEH